MLFCVLLQCNTYKEQYNAAFATAKKLQKQLDEVADLQHAVTEAHEVQVVLTYKYCTCYAVCLHCITS